MKRKRGQGIIKVSDLFKKYKEILKAPQATVIDGFIESVYEVVGIKIHSHQCSYTPKTQTFILTAPGTIKTEVFFKKQQIFENLTKKLGVKSTPKHLL